MKYSTRRFLSTAAIAVVAFLSLSSMASEPLPSANPPGQIALEFSTGDPKGAYYGFINEVAGVCGGTTYRVVPKASSGSPENLDRMLANEVAGGPVQLDVAKFYQDTHDLSGLAVLIPMFPEQVHFITRANLGKVEAAEVFGRKIEIGGWRPGAKEVVISDAADFKGKIIVAAGGSFYTGQMLRHPSVGEMPMDLKEITGPSASSDAIAGVLKGTYDGAIMVAAQPSKIIAGMGDQAAKLKLVPVPDAMLSKINRLYPTKTSVSYRQMGANGTNVQTFEVMSALLVQNYTSGKYAQAFDDLRRCILDHAKDLAGQPGTSLAWRRIAKSGEDPVPNWKRWELAPVAGVKSSPASKNLASKAR